MHEFGIVEALVSQVLEKLKHAHIQQVDAVYFRRSSAFSEEALTHAFRALTVHTPLENACLMIETVNLEYTCPCGNQTVITSDDLIGHMYFCPICGEVYEVNEAHDLE
jgi:Zn finger protein HypA/HybF involved in hydrogenase expression